MFKRNSIAAACMMLGSVALLGGAGCAVETDDAVDEALEAADAGVPEESLETSDDALWAAGYRRGFGYRGGVVGYGRVGYGYGGVYGRGYAYRAPFVGGYGMYW